MEEGPIKVERVLGQGGMGTVFLTRNAQGEPLALKVLRAPATGLREMFEQEVGILSRLKHPRLVEILGFSKAGLDLEGVPKGPSFWMEYVAGQPLLEAAKGADASQVLAWFEEALEALEYLHSQDILHGDLKPANVLVTKDGHVKVVDFGLATLTQTLKGPGERPKGSIPYMAPESLEGERLPAGDLFALGTVFYEALAGKHPRAGAKNLKSLFATDFPRLVEKNPGVPPRTARVIERLIAPDLSIRLKTAHETRVALKQEEVAPDESTDFYSFKMLGIETQWSRFFTFCRERKKLGRRGVTLVHGLTGVGKSRWMRELFFELALQGERVLQGPREFFPKMEGNDGFLIQLIPGAEDLNPLQLKELYRFLRQGEGPPGILLLEYNDESLDGFHRDFFSNMAKEDGVLDLTLQNLSFADAQRFLHHSLRRDLPESVDRELFERTQGNPKLLTEMGREILKAGILRKKNLTPELFQQLGLPKTAREIFSSRLERLNSGARGLLNLIALHPGSARTEILLVLGAEPLEKLKSHLQQLSAAGLITPDWESEGDAHRLTHPSLSRLIQEKLGTAQKRRIHGAWLQTLESHLPPNGPNEIGWMAPLAFHALQVPGAARRVQWVNRAAELYTAQEDHEKARRLYEQCLDSEMEPGEREAMIRASINSLGRMGRFRDSLAQLEAWFEKYGQDPAGLNPVKYYLSSGVIHQNLGDLREAGRRFARCIEVGRVDQPEQRPLLARAYSLLGLIDIQIGENARARENLAQALKLLPKKSTQTAEIFKHRALLAAKEKNWVEALAQLKVAEDLYRELSHGTGVFSVALEHGNLALLLGRLEESRQAYVQARNIAQQNKDDASLARVHQNLGVLDCRRGIFHRGIQDLERAREILAFLGSPEDRGLNSMQLALAHASVGHFEKADGLMELPRKQHAFSESHAQRFREIEFLIAIIRRGRWPGDQPNPFADKLKEAPQGWDMERRLLRFMAEVEAGQDRSREIQAILKTVHDQLPDALRIGFEERGDWRRYVLNEETEDNMNTMEKVAQITKALLSTTDFDKVLVNLMDAAMELSKARHGFLILRSEEKGGPIPGFAVKVARNMAKEDVDREDFKLSHSALKEAMDKGRAFVTDNALTDSRFASAESVHALELKSILALPLKTPQGVVGAIYLDQPYRTNVFQKADLQVLEIMADQAALALQKAEMISQLEKNNVELTETVKDQAGEIGLLKREVEEQRIQLQHEYKDIIGRSRPMLEVLSLVDRVTDTMVPVWIYGESGTGKEMIARALHFNSTRAKRAFVSENCSALPETLLESELFGHKKGAFTHADRDKKGLLEHADGGTVFLDEIADMSMAMQAKLLRFLQEGEIRPLGSNQIVKVDVRVVSASNRNLQKLVAEGKFREDLYYRLVGVTITLPPLRDRLEDIPLLVQHFVKKITQEEGKEPMEITPEALVMLMDYNWPGNVRELENTLRTAVLFHQKGQITPKSLHFKRPLTEETVSPAPAQPAATAAQPPVAPGPAAKPPRDLPEEKRLLLKALLDSGYHKGNAAKVLGISRRYLYTQLLRHQVPVNRIEMKAYIEHTLKPR